jgi:hypothetical protein
MNLVKDAEAGAVGGLAGGMAMTAFMVGATKAGVITSSLPLRTDRWIQGSPNITAPPQSAQEQARAQAMHLAYSAMLGAGFGILSATLHLKKPVPSGPLYGMGIYAINLLGVLPLFGLTKGPWNESKMTVARRVMMHNVFGLVTALVTKKVRQRLG